MADRTAASISAGLGLSGLSVGDARGRSASVRRVAALRASKTPGTELAARVAYPGELPR